MAMKLGSALIHLVMFAVVCAITAFWGVKLLTPLPTAAPPPVAAPLPREPEPALAARMFGLVQQAAPQLAANIQVTGLFAAGRQSGRAAVGDLQHRSVRGVERRRRPCGRGGHREQEGKEQGKGDSEGDHEGKVHRRRRRC
jgi:hypothetical protein